MNRKLLLALMAGVLTFGFASMAFAQDMDESDPNTKVIYKKTTTIDFSDAIIEGELSKPQGSYISARKQASFNKLIRERENFVSEMELSVDNL
ncbi:MAG: hypothetical protein GMKNLPBB_01807 [Myxococcota bacterium]|nr:hypothetical protein [Myxococcota bacterium]